jgi:hypothetical protein
VNQPAEFAPGSARNPLGAETRVIEPKVAAARVGAGVGAGAGSVVATFVFWVLSTYVFHGEVPEPVVGFVYLVITVVGAAGLAWWRGRQAPHQFRYRPGENVAAAKPRTHRVGGYEGGPLPPPRTPR